MKQSGHRLPSRGMVAALPLITFYLHQLWPAFFCYGPLAILLALVSAFVLYKCGRARLALHVLLVLATYLVVGRATRLVRPSYAFAAKHLTAVEGILVEDSALTRSKAQVVRLSLQGCSIAEDGAGSAAGTIGALVPLVDFLPAASTIHLDGKMSDDPSFFLASEVRLVEISSVATLRRRAIAWVQNRFTHLLGQSEAKVLAVMLLLGQSEAEGFVLKDLAMASGCAHTLALSGMHLSFFCTISVLVLRLFVGKRRAQILGLAPPMLFVSIAGPKPSLVRSLLFRTIATFHRDAAAASLGAFLLQLLFFPEALGSLAAWYSWAAFSALLVADHLPKIPLRSTAMAIAATAPITLLQSGSWNPIGLLFAPPVTLLISAAMGCSLLLLLVGELAAGPMQWVTALIVSLLSEGSIIPIQLGILGYASYLLVLLTSFAAIGYAESSRKKARRRAYEVGVRIRLTQGDQRPVGGAGVCDDEEVWTELSALHADSPEDRQALGPQGGSIGP